MKHLLTILFATLTLSAWAQENQEIRPRFARMFDKEHPDVHDPVMARGEDGRYYIFSTGMNIGRLSSTDMKS